MLAWCLLCLDFLCWPKSVVGRCRLFVAGCYGWLVFCVCVFVVCCHSVLSLYVSLFVVGCSLFVVLLSFSLAVRLCVRFVVCRVLSTVCCSLVFVVCCLVYVVCIYLVC